MNTVAGTLERRTIKVKDFLDDYRLAVGDLELMQKYHLSVRGLDKFVQLLVDRRILTSDEVALRNEKTAFARSNPTNPETEHSAFMCPSCLITWPEMFDVCPNCGIVVQEYMAQPQIELEAPSEHPACAPTSGDGAKSGESLVQAESHVAHPQGGHTGQPEVAIDHPGGPSPAARNSMEEGPGASLDEHAVVAGNEARSCAGSGDSDHASSLQDRKASHSGADRNPIEIPLFEDLSETPSQAERPSAPLGSRLMQSFVWAKKVQQPAPGDSESDEDLIPGTPIGCDEDGIVGSAAMQTWCSSCAIEMEPALRRVFDRSGTRASLMLSGVFFLLGFVGAYTLTLFNGYSFARLLVIYGTGMLVMCGGVCLTAGFFMHMAKERVFRCPNCDRVCPRA